MQHFAHLLELEYLIFVSNSSCVHVFLILPINIVAFSLLFVTFICRLFNEVESNFKACVDKGELMTKDNLKFAFRFLDHDNTKTLNVKNILHAFVTKPNKEIETIFMITLKEVDKDGDGIIKFGEFCEYRVGSSPCL